MLLPPPFKRGQNHVLEVLDQSVQIQSSPLRGIDFIPFNAIVLLSHFGILVEEMRCLSS